MTSDAIYYMCSQCAHVETREYEPDRCENCHGHRSNLRSFLSFDDALDHSDLLLERADR